jgi:hypothetical protein
MAKRANIINESTRETYQMAILSLRFPSSAFQDLILSNAAFSWTAEVSVLKAFRC